MIDIETLETEIRSLIENDCDGETVVATMRKRHPEMTVTDFHMAAERAAILQKFYDARHTKNDWLTLPVEPSASEEERRIAYNICRQLGESGLIEWKGFLGDINGAGRITNLGVDVIEGNTPSPIAVTIDSRQYSVHGSSNVQIGEGNAQNITFTAEKIIAAINSSQAPPAEKEKAKSILHSILDSTLLSKLLGFVIGEA